jgi:hypothetical protein
MKREACYSHRDILLAEWLYEDGIGEERAILIENGRIIEARIWRHDGVKAGLVTQAKLVKQLVAGKRGIARIDDGSELLVSPLPPGVCEGGTMKIEVTRAAIDEKSRFKLALARPAQGKPVSPAQNLAAQIGAHTPCRAHQPDRFAEAGWHEVIEEARSGVAVFPGGTLQIFVTPAMTLIDIDGDLPPLPLSIAAASAAADAIRRLDIQGMIGIDFPGVADKAERTSIAQAFGAAMAGPYERTAINGFGFLQLVRKRRGPSLLELVQYRRTIATAAALLRHAERDARTGPLALVAQPAVVALLETRQDWTSELTRRTGRPVILRADAALANGGYYAA